MARKVCLPTIARRLVFGTQALGFALFVLVYTPRVAYPNGRFPKAQVVLTVPGSDGKTVFVRATFGILISRDTGRTWAWLCERALGFSSTWDPPITVTRDGRLWVGLTDGLRVVSPDGCHVESVPALDGELIADLSLEPGGERVVGVTSTPDRPAYVFRSTRKTLERLGQGVSGVKFDTIDVAPSLPSTVYATGVQTGAGPRAHLFVSEDSGASLVELRPKLPRDGRLFLAAVDPKNHKRLFVREVGDGGSDLLVSSDGGHSFVSVLHTNSAMFGFAQSPEGQTLWVGAGDPKEGLYRSTDRGATFRRVSDVSTLCLHVHREALWACSNPFTRDGWAVGRFHREADSVRLEPLSTFADIQGAVPCEGGPALECEAAWPETRAQIRGEVVDDDERSERGQATGADASDPQVIDAAAAPSDALAPASTQAKKTRGCSGPSALSSCRTTPLEGSGIFGAALLGNFALFAWRRRSRRGEK